MWVQTYTQISVAFANVFNILLLLFFKEPGSIWFDMTKSRDQGFILGIWVDMGGANFFWLGASNFYPKVGEILAKYGDPDRRGFELWKYAQKKDKNTLINTSYLSQFVIQPFSRVCLPKCRKMQVWTSAFSLSTVPILRFCEISARGKNLEENRQTLLEIMKICRAETNMDD